MTDLLFVANCDLEGPGLYGSLLAERGADLSVVHPYRGEVLPDPATFDGLIIGGTPISAYQTDAHPWLAVERDWLASVAEADLPCLAVCCGAQLMATVMGGRAYPNPVMEIGGHDVTLTDAGKAHPLLAGFPDTFRVFQWHGDTFDVPPGGQLLGSSAACAHQAFACGRTLGVLFHLELTAADAAIWCARYAEELAGVGKTAEQVVAECVEREAAMGELAGMLVESWLGQL